MWKGSGGGAGVVEGEEEAEFEQEEAEVEAEEEEALAQREGRRRWAGRAGLRKFFSTEEDSLFPCGGTDELTHRVITLSHQHTTARSDTLHGVTCPICGLLDPGGNNRHISKGNTNLAGS